MSPDATTTTEPAESTAPSTPAPSTEPAKGADGPRLNTLTEAFRQQPDALKGTNRGQGPSADRDDPASPEASAEQASKPGEGEDRGPSRRGAAARITEQQAEIDRLVTERERERQRADELKAASDEQAKQRDARATAAMARVGDDRDFAELSNRRMRGATLSYEEDQRLDEMLAWREHAADLWEITERAHKQAVVKGLADRVQRYGLEKAIAYDAPLADLLDHTVSVTETRVRRESANEIAELKAELRGYRTGKAGGKAPTVGGASTPGGVAVPPDGSGPLDFFRAGARERESANGAARAAPNRR